MKKFLLIIICSFFYFQASGQDNGAKRIASLRKEIKQALKDTTDNGTKEHPLLENEETAVKVAEAILFHFFEQENIIKQRPYKVFLIDGYWIIKGSFPKNMAVGGVFEIILNSIDGKIIKITHGK